MAYDRDTAARVRAALADEPAASAQGIEEKGMVGGGLGFLVGGRLCCGARASGLTVRIDADRRAELLAGDHVGPLVLGKREPKAFVVVEPEGYATEEDLTAWIRCGLDAIAGLDG